MFYKFVNQSLEVWILFAIATLVTAEDHQLAASLPSYFIQIKLSKYFLRSINLHLFQDLLTKLEMLIDHVY